MTAKRKSVTFHDTVSMVYIQNFDGSSSPDPRTTSPTITSPSPGLDPMYLTWLRQATKAQYPCIVNGTFAKHVYHQNFDEHLNMKRMENFQRAQEKEAAVPALAEKYGSLGWGSLYRRVTEEAWVKNYRPIYRFDGSDEQLLEKIAEAYGEIKRTIAEEEKSSAYSTLDRKWETFTQAGGPLISPDFGPTGVNLHLNDAADAPSEDEGPEPVLFAPSNQGSNGDGMLFDMGSVSRDFGTAMVNSGTEVRVFGAGFG